ncbi:MAG: glycine cleavage system aminomethyltransferase GcvT [bacterium]
MINSSSPKRTALHHTHVALGAKIVEFGGYLMPVQYRGIIEEHHKVRSAAGIFDVSHMGQFEFRGAGALAFLQRMTINDVSKLEIGQAQYSALCYPEGGMVDDVIVYRLPDRYLAVVNAANLRKDWDWLAQHADSGVDLRDASAASGLLAVQGRHAEPTLQKLTRVPLQEIKYYWCVQAELAGVPALLSRTGYTGEDGFEVGCASEHLQSLWEAIMAAGAEFGLEPIGLGARDTLRLEMKFCLYGNDIDQNTNPIEAGLGWITKFDKGDFIGKTVLVQTKAAGPQRKLVGFEVEGKNIARHGFAIFKEGQKIGHVTSGTFSPSLQKSIGLGYVATPHSAAGTEMQIDVRGRMAPARLVKTPFYQRPY